MISDHFYIRGTMRNLLLIILLSCYPLIFHGASFQQETDAVTDIKQALAAADAVKLAVYFDNTIDLTIPDAEGSYSKKQSEQLFKAFFTSNPVKSFTLDHQGNSNDGSQYMIGTYKTQASKVFRVYILLKTVSAKLVVQQIQFEEE